MSDYTDLEIYLSPEDADHYRVVLRYTDPDDPAGQSLHRGVAAFNRLELRNKQLNPSAYGQLLYNSLLSDLELRGYFIQVRGVAQNAGKFLRLRLYIDAAAPELHELRWETLRDPQDGGWLLTDESLLFSRFLSSSNWKRIQLRSKADLRALVAIANPQDLSLYEVNAKPLPPVNTEEELKRARQGLKKFLRSSLVSDPAKPGQVTLKNILARLREGEGYDILYLVCHGALLGKDPAIPYLYLENEDGTVAKQPGILLVDHIRDLLPKIKPRLVVLVSCQSGGKGSDIQGALSALGPRLAEAGVPAVIAMQGDVSMETMANFMPRFYEELAKDGQIDRAVAAARGEVRQHPDSWMPVLYMRLKNGCLWEDEFTREDTPDMAPQATRLFLGRNDILEKIKQRLKEATTPTVTVLVQTPGIGKTEMAACLAQDEDLKERYREGILWAPLGKKPEIIDLLSSWARELKIPAEEIAQVKRNTLKEHITALVKLINRTIKNRRMLLIVDDAWKEEHITPFRVIGAQCDLLVTTRSLQVAGEITADEAIVKDITGEKVISIDELNELKGLFKLKELSPEDGLEVLHSLAPNAMSKPEDIEIGLQLVQAVGALPQALVLMGRYLSPRSLTGKARRITEALGYLQDAQARLNLKMNHLPGRPEDMPLSLMAAIDMSMEEQDDTTRQALYQLSIFRPKPHAISDEDAIRIFGIEYECLDNLADAGLLEVISDREDNQPLHGSPAGDQEEQVGEETLEYYSIPRTISDYARAHLTEQQIQSYHQNAVDYYASLLVEYENNRSGDSNSYKRNYSYEQSQWQTLKSAWLYHQAQTTDRTEANLNLAQIYFDAFWWWRCYNEDFPFCNRLLSEWREIQSSQQDRRWLALLTRFLNAYPTGYEKAGKGDLQAVEEALLEIRRIGGLDGDLATLNHDQKRQHIRAITNFFLAESYRFRSVNDPRADAIYAESVSILEKHMYTEDDDWNLPWAYWHIADLALERGQWEKALNYVEMSMQKERDSNDELLSPNRDNEIIANNYRVIADVYWQQGELEQAFDNYALAVFYAYLFQWLPKCADFYTAEFYAEMTTRTQNRIWELWAGGKKDASLQACASLRQFWNSYWMLEGCSNEAVDYQAYLEQKDLPGLATDIFPRHPTENDMNEDSEYVNQVKFVVNALQNKVEDNVDREVKHG